MLQLPKQKFESLKTALLKGGEVSFSITEKGTESGSFVLEYQGTDGKNHKFQQLKNEDREAFSPADLKVLASIKKEARIWLEKRRAAAAAADEQLAEAESLDEIWAKFGEDSDQATKARAAKAATALLAEDASGVNWVQSFFFNYAPSELYELGGIDWVKVEEIRLDPRQILRMDKDLEGKRVTGSRAWIPADYNPRADVWELDLNKAYAAAALAEGIISAKTFARLQKASKAFRLVAFGALATRSQRTDYVSKGTAVRYVNRKPEITGRAIDAKASYSEADFEAVYKELDGGAMFPTVEAFAAAEGFDRVESAVFEVTQHPATRPETAPVFFHIAAKVGRDMEAIARAAGAYFFWVDAIFCPAAGIAASKAKAKALGYEYKIFEHQNIFVQKGIINVLKGGDDKPSPYAIPKNRIDGTAARFNALKRYVSKYAECLTPSDFVELVDKQLDREQVQSILSGLGLSLGDITELVSVAREGADFSGAHTGFTGTQSFDPQTGEALEISAPVGFTSDPNTPFTVLTVSALSEYMASDQYTGTVYEILRPTDYEASLAQIAKAKGAQ